MRPIFSAHLLRLAGFVLTMSMAGWAMAQADFVINGRLKVEGGTMSGSRLVVYKNGEKHRVITTDLNRFSLPLDLNEEYLLSFEKDGFVTKKLSFNTKVPSGSLATGYTPFDFVVSLFKQYDGVNIVVFNQPVGIIRYADTLGDFDYDTDYTKSIQSALDAVQAEIAKKQKEEERSMADAKRRKDKEDKAEAKAAVKAEREVAQQEKAKAKEKEEVREEVKKEVVADVAPAPEVKPEPVPEPRKEPKPRPVAPTPKISSASLMPPMEGSDQRRSLSPVVGHDPSPVQPARPRSAEEARPVAEHVHIPVVRHQDVIVQNNEVITVIQIGRGEEMTEYRRVARKYSGIYYFKNGKSCSQLTYEQEALAEN